MIAGYRISTHTADMDIDVIHAFLTTSYWAAGIPRETVQQAVENSLCWGLFTQTGQQVGFARAITDHATFAYLSDVFIDEAHRGKGLSKWLLREVHNHPSLQGLRRLMLATKDAHGLYQQYDYTPLAQPQMFMEQWYPQVYGNNG